MKNVNPEYWPGIRRGIPPYGCAPGASTCAGYRDTLRSFFLRKSAGRNAMPGSSTAPSPTHAERARTPRMLSDAGVGPEIYLSGATLDAITPVEAEIRRGEAAGRGDPLPVVPTPLRGRVARRARGGGAAVSPCAASQARSRSPRSSAPRNRSPRRYSDWLFDFQPEKWFAPARRSFGELAEAAEKAGTDLFVENVFDEIPDHLLRLRDAVGSPRASTLLDAAAGEERRVTGQAEVEAGEPTASRRRSRWSGISSKTFSTKRSVPAFSAASRALRTNAGPGRTTFPAGSRRASRNTRRGERFRRAEDRGERDRACDAAHGEAAAPPPRARRATRPRRGRGTTGSDPRVPQLPRDGFRLDRGDRVEGRPER